MAEKNRYIELSDGNKMPIMGYGTFLCEDSEELTNNVVHAIMECGYRHIDTAALYKNEAAIGEALKICFDRGLKREDLFIVTKVWRDSYHDVQGSLNSSLENLGLEYIDLFLIHWTMTDVDWDTYEIKGPSMYETWKELEIAKDEGKVKSIGISNCNNMLFVDICAGAKKHKPVMNQIECNPYFSQPKVVDFQGKFGTKITAYAPIGAAGFTGNNLLDDATLKEIAEKHSATVAQISLAWNMQRGVAVIPKSMTKERIQQNFDALDITLDEEDIEKIDGLNTDVRVFNPENWNYPHLGWIKNPIYY